MNKIHSVSCCCAVTMRPTLLSQLVMMVCMAEGDGPPAPRSSMVPLFGLQELCSRHRGLRRHGSKPAMERHRMCPTHAGRRGVIGEANKDWTKNDRNILRYVEHISIYPINPAVTNTHTHNPHMTKLRAVGYSSQKRNNTAV